MLSFEQWQQVKHRHHHYHQQFIPRLSPDLMAPDSPALAQRGLLECVPL